MNPAQTSVSHLNALTLKFSFSLPQAVRLETSSPVRLRYLLIVGTLDKKQESLVLGMDFPGSNR